MSQYPTELDRKTTKEKQQQQQKKNNNNNKHSINNRNGSCFQPSSSSAVLIMLTPRPRSRHHGCTSRLLLAGCLRAAGGPQREEATLCAVFTRRSIARGHVALFRCLARVSRAVFSATPRLEKGRVAAGQIRSVVWK